MTPTQVQSTLQTIRRMFPRNTLSDDEMQLFGEAIIRIDIDEHQAEAVVRQYRMGCKFNNPVFNDLQSAFYGAARPKASNPTDPKRNLLVDIYRKRDGLPSHTPDIEVARWKARQCVSDWGVAGARSHLVEMLRELKTLDDVEVWRIAFEMFPDAAMQAKVRERIKRVRDKVKMYESRRSKEPVQ